MPAVHNRYYPICKMIALKAICIVAEKRNSIRHHMINTRADYKFKAGRIPGFGA